MKSKFTCFIAFFLCAAVTLSTRAQSFLTNGLIAYFPFDGTALDGTTNGNDGTLLGSAAFGVDRFGNSNSCLALPGTQGVGSGVDVPSLSSLPYYPVTYSAWFVASNFPSTPSGPSTEMTLLGREQCEQQYDGAIIVSGNPDGIGNNTLDYFTGGTGAYATIATPLGAWCQIVVTIASNRAVTFYLNGTNLPIFGTTTAEYYSPNEDFRIGASSGSGCAYEHVWNGLIDDVRIYNRALASNEVQSLYSYETSLTNPAPTIAIGLSPTVTITGVAGYTYAIQRNNNLSNTNTWTTITNITLNQPVEIWADTSVNTSIPGSAQQYYRVLLDQ